MRLENIKKLEHFTLGKSYVLKQMQYTEDLVIENDLGERKRLNLKATTISEVNRTELKWLATYFNFISDKNEMPIVRQTGKQKRIVTQVKVGSWINLGLVCLLISYLFRFIDTWTDAYTFFLSDFLFSCST